MQTETISAAAALTAATRSGSSSLPCDLTARSYACWRRTAASATGASAVAVDAPTLYEFAVRTPRPAAVVLERLAEEGYLGGVDLAAHYPELGDAILLAVTETRTRADVDDFVSTFEKAVR